MSLVAESLIRSVYSPGMAGSLAGVSGQSIGQWARHGFIEPTIYEGRPSNLYSYQDVAESIVIRWLLSRHIPYEDIRLAIRDARADFPHWPLLHADLGVGRLSESDPARLVKKTGPSAYLDISRRGRQHPGQIIIEPTDLQEARDMLANGGWIAAQAGLSRIEVAPLKLGGLPSLRGRRWAIGQVARIAADAAGRAILENDYALEPIEIDESVAWMTAARALAKR